MPAIYTIRVVLLGTAALVATAITALSIAPRMPTTVAMQLSPEIATIAVGDTTDISVVVESPVAVNAFSGEVVFDSNVFEVASISYNTSIANLWVEEPWYNRSDNSVYFAGGTTAPGGFTGRGALLTISLRALQPGDVEVALEDIRILLHDGLGTDAEIQEPLDSVFTATGTSSVRYVPPSEPTSALTVRTQLPDPDLNGDGMINFLDISILLTRLGSSDERYDLNGDGAVNTRDFQMIQAAR